MFILLGVIKDEFEGIFDIVRRAGQFCWQSVNKKNTRSSYPAQLHHIRCSHDFQQLVTLAVPLLTVLHVSVCAQNQPQNALQDNSPASATFGLIRPTYSFTTAAVAKSRVADIIVSPAASTVCRVSVQPWLFGGELNGGLRTITRLTLSDAAEVGAVSANAIHVAT